MRRPECEFEEKDPSPVPRQKKHPGIEGAFFSPYSLGVNCIFCLKYNTKVIHGATPAAMLCTTSVMPMIAKARFVRLLEKYYTVINRFRQQISG